MIGSESEIRLGFFVALFVLFAAWEAASPRRRRTLTRRIRWVSNLGLTAINSLLPPLIVPIAAVGAALAARENGAGLFNRVEAPQWLAFAGSVVALDFIVYLQHRMFHAVPVLWRLHRVHHSDVDLDVSSGVRFHFAEILISLGIKIAAILLLGPPATAVLVFEIVLNGTSLFNHANLRLPLRVDRVLRWFLVTPDMHRVHHSVVWKESNSNFGFNLPWWDRLCGTYTAQPEAGHEGMRIGLEAFRSERDQRIGRLLWQPFRRAAALRSMLAGPRSGPGETEGQEK